MRKNKTLTIGCLHAFLAVAALGPQPASGIEKQAPLATKGEKLFTQFSLYYWKGDHLTTNYRVGTLVPINTEVEFVKASKNSITVKIPSYNVQVDFVNVEDYSGEKIGGIFSRTFGRTPVDLSVFTELEKGAIQRGAVVVGMRKDAVLRAMGFPPRHKTPTLSMNEWRYWKSRLDTVLVSFENDQVVSITD